MLYTYKIVTRNINGISSPLEMQMLHNFLFRRYIDLALVHEVTNNDSSTICGYAALVNEGIDKRGTAIVLKEGLSLSNIKRLPSGRGIAGLFKDTWIMNIYAPPGAEKRQERETIFTHDLAFPASSRDILLAGDFNCVTSPSNCIGTPNLSKALSSTIAGFALYGVWESLPNNLHVHTTRTTVLHGLTEYV